MDQSYSTTGPLNLCHVNKHQIFFNRTYMVIHSIALSFLLYYRASFFFTSHDTKTPMLAWLIVFAAELALSFVWLVGQTFYWRPVSRTVFPERLPEDDKLPGLDVFICTADPEMEPTVEVMNTVISATALDYPPEKLHVYLSDDGGADVTLNGMREAWTFAKMWIPFCKRYNIKCRSPKAYFSAAYDDTSYLEENDFEFVEERRNFKEKYEVFEERVREYTKHGDTGINKRQDHSTVIEMIGESPRNHGMEEETKTNNMPLLVYVSREKRPPHDHNFKAGALNVLLRVSGVISNSPIILGLDCDMYCNDPTSARKAMCFHLDPKLSPSLAFVQFPQKFDNLSKHDIYDSQGRVNGKVIFNGFDGHEGPFLCGTCYYMKRVSLYRRSTEKVQKDLIELRQWFGPSHEFVKTLHENYKPNMNMSAKLAEANQLASCAYEDGTIWGEVVGNLYGSLSEDYFTSFANLHCKGWKSVYYNPPTPQFFGKGTTNLNDVLVQLIRWSSGGVDVAISKYSPLIYGPSKMSILESVCYAWIGINPLCCFFSLWCLASIPQLCLLNDIALYPEVSNSYFWIFCFVFLSSALRHLYEVLTTGESLQYWIYEQRMWMMKAITSHLYGSMYTFMRKLGLRKTRFFLTNKVDDDEQVKRYNSGVFDFQTSAVILVPMASLVILNMASSCVGIVRMVFFGELQLLIQVFIATYVVVLNYPIIEGMLIRNDKGRIRASITLLSTATAFTIIVFFGSVIFM